MHASHIANLQSIIPNLDHAVFNGDVVTVGGGDFDADMLRSLSLAAKWVIARQKQANTDHELEKLLYDGVEYEA